MSRCGFTWGACEKCLGSVLDTHGPVARCSRCAGEWPARDVEPCPREAVTMIDEAGLQVPACASHAKFARSSKSTDRWLVGCSVFVYPLVAAAAFGALYLLVRFVKWAWQG